MPHRGRLNVLTNIVGKSYDQLFKEFEGQVDPDSMQGSGDVKYHLGQTGKFVARSGKDITVELAANPSHLEAVDPVVVGMARAKQDAINDPEAFSVLPILMHGDAAFAGQGVVAETLNMSDIKGYRVGGTIHVVVNNQIGFTTTPEAARSGFYSTDVAKIIQAPIFHVNGDDPEACVRVARLAFAFRQRFHKDVVIDMVCYRRHGHNEGDDPSYTQPLMYAKIDQRRSVRKLFTESLVKRGQLSLEEAEGALDDFQKRAADGARGDATDGSDLRGARQGAAASGRRAAPRRDRRRPRTCSTGSTSALSTFPDTFQVHPKLLKQFEARDKLWAEGEVDWALAEAMAYGSLLLEGTDIRMAGQDTRRGTFSHRHAVLVDHTNGDEYAPLAHLGAEQGKFWIYDSLLSEYAALGFEYGYSVVAKDSLVVWEAQFGDFWNGASTIVDQFVVSAEDKWNQTAGLVLYLPHGYEGQGPEHSSGRVERFLTLCAEDNIQVANCTQASQIFHLLRRQVRRAVRKPLVVFTPKSLLRARAMRSPVSELLDGSFRETIDDPGVADPSAVTRIVLATGKVAHDAIAARDESGAPVAVVRVEQLYPWPYDQLAEIVERYPNATDLVWLQEEPENMGAVELRQGPALRAVRRHPPDPPRVALRVGQPRHRLPHRPRPGADPAPRPRSLDASGQREADHRFELGEGVGGVDDLDRGHAHGGGRLEVHAEVVEEHHLGRLDPAPLAGELVEARVGLPHADLAALDHVVEQAERVVAAAGPGTGREVVEADPVVGEAGRHQPLAAPPHRLDHRRADLAGEQRHQLPGGHLVALLAALRLEQVAELVEGRPRCARTAPRRWCRGWWR